MPAPRRYPQELRERALRLVPEARREDSELSLNAAVVRIGQRTGVNADTLRRFSGEGTVLQRDCLRVHSGSLPAML